jgi:hypothetical protein
MDLSLKGLVHSHYSGIPNSFSVVNDILSRAKLDVGEQAYRTPYGGVSLRRLLLALEQERSPLDLVWDAFDDNGLPLNPKWRYQVVTGKYPDLPSMYPLPDISGLDPATALAVLADAPRKALASGFGGLTSQQLKTDTTWLCGQADHWLFGGHLNWFPVTYEGSIIWEGHDPNWPLGDDDYNIQLYRQDKAGLTAKSAEKGFLKLEFDSDETIDHFNTPWWNDFHHVVDNDSTADDHPGWWIDLHFAIATGLFGLDCMHGVTTESHPVFALAIRENSDPSDYQEAWAIFVRNYGNEGYCGDLRHYLDLQSYSFRLPWKQGATTVAVDWNQTQFHTNTSHVTGPSVQWAQYEGVLVTFTLPPPEEEARVDGELYLQWQ